MIRQLLLTHTDHLEKSLKLVINIKLREPLVWVKTNMSDVLKVSWHSNLFFAESALVFIAFFVILLLIFGWDIGWDAWVHGCRLGQSRLFRLHMLLSSLLLFSLPFALFLFALLGH